MSEIASVKLELLYFCQSESLSAEGLREIIERHGLTPNNDLLGVVGRYSIAAAELHYRIFHEACRNERVTEEIIQCLLEYFPAAAGDTFWHEGRSPLHFACCNKNVTLNIVRLLVDAAPASIRSLTNDGSTPLHVLCTNRKVDDAAAIDILKLLIEKYPEALQHEDTNRLLPIHFASGLGARSPEFCRVLIEAYPGSERITDVSGSLPLHHACAYNYLATVEYLYMFHPDSASHATTGGVYPIHIAIKRIAQKRGNPIHAVKVVQFLLECDPKVKLQKLEDLSTLEGRSLLHFACQLKCKGSSILAHFEVIKAIYNAHPEAIEDNRIASGTHKFRQQVQSFITSELVYARQAKDHRLMITPDDNGQLPLHKALRNNATLGSIKLLVKGNPSAIRTVDAKFAMPLHIACEHQDSTTVVQHLLDADTKTLQAVDYDNNTPLHCACRGAKYDTIALLLETYGAVSVSKRNADKKFPINLLWESNEVSDRENIKYTESLFRLMREYPEVVKISD